MLDKMSSLQCKDYICLPWIQEEHFPYSTKKNNKIKSPQYPAEMEAKDLSQEENESNQQPKKQSERKKERMGKER